MIKCLEGVKNGETEFKNRCEKFPGLPFERKVWTQAQKEQNIKELNNNDQRR